MKRLLVVLSVVCCMSTVGCARDRDVQAVVSAMEHRYGLHHSSIPLFARAFIPAGSPAKGVEFFENQRLPASVSMQELETLATTALGAGWKAFVRVDSKRDREKTLIYAKTEGKQMYLLVITTEADETTVAKLKADGPEAKNWIVDPVHERD